ncbi:uncharacterized protein G2W53_028132 [Senna tora]|uniref:Uncharacterized protein n=1 Tax=Senna tora TaxID=362788 RepID=A0A834T0D9_9FABA|nr:uncharacterized protein G2W53_028132 [Senna tora]
MEGNQVPRKPLMGCNVRLVRRRSEGGEGV